MNPDQEFLALLASSRENLRIAATSLVHSSDLKVNTSTPTLEVEPIPNAEIHCAFWKSRRRSDDRQVPPTSALKFLTNVDGGNSASKRYTTITHKWCKQLVLDTIEELPQELT